MRNGLSSTSCTGPSPSSGYAISPVDPIGNEPPSRSISVGAPSRSARRLDRSSAVARSTGRGSAATSHERQSSRAGRHRRTARGDPRMQRGPDLMIRSCRTRPTADASRRLTGRGLQLYASAQAEPRARRPTDIALAIVSATAVALCVAFAEVASTFEADLLALIDSIPDLFEPLWRLAFLAPVAYSVVLILVAFARGRRALVRDSIGSIVLALLLTAAIAALVMDDGRSVFELLFDVNGPPVFPPGAAGGRHGRDLDVVAPRQPAVPSLRAMAHRARSCSPRCSCTRRCCRVPSPRSPSARCRRRSSTSSPARQEVVRRSRGSGLRSPTSACTSMISRRRRCNRRESCCSRPLTGRVRCSSRCTGATRGTPSCSPRCGATCGTAAVSADPGVAGSISSSTRDS